MDLKLSLVGYSFSGKSTQAKLIKEKYGLDVYNMDELVKEAIELYETNTEPIENPNKEESNQEAQND